MIEISICWVPRRRYLSRHEHHHREYMESTVQVPNFQQIHHSQFLFSSQNLCEKYVVVTATHTSVQAKRVL